MQVADNVEGATLATLVAPQGHPLEARSVNRCHRVEGVDRLEALSPQILEPLSQAMQVVADHPRTNRPVATRCVVGNARPLVYVEDESNREHVLLAGNADKVRSVLWLD